MSAKRVDDALHVHHTTVKDVCELADVTGSVSGRPRRGIPRAATQR